MKHILIWFSFMSVLATISTGQSSSVPADAVSDTNAVYNFKLILSFPKTTFTNGEPVICLAGLTNISDSPTYVVPSFFEVNLMFCVTNANGDQVTQLDKDFSPTRYAGRELVPPHSAEIGLYPRPLNTGFTLSPGKYDVAVERRMGWPSMTLKSEAVTITILDSPMPAPTTAPVSRP
jgi:hypothetical protein